MKIGLFTDSHYCTKEIKCNTRRPLLSYSKLDEAINVFKVNNVELIICLGDLIDTDDEENDIGNLIEISSLLNKSGIECLCCMGNHDAFLFDKSSFEKFTGLKTAPLSVVKNGKRLILLDANYDSSQLKYSREKTDWIDSNIPDYEVEWLKSTLSDCLEKEIFIYVHQNLDPAVESHHIIKNAAEIREILANDGRVRAVYQGHFHHGGENTIDNIKYVTLKAMCEGTENYFMILDI
ncbi:MAG: hypothetical protein A2Y15_00025 [Clostridiales bacterium GWF2_36_10]|nr:MAG: hypothetical protein A2Y15_00025 [Clostridiales bacterium GWF2_36_10]HAN20507.1 hypothetical protein [Clostridiales bacterium]